MPTSDREELVFALCHEVGNWLAAARMHTHLLDPDSNSGEIAQVVATLNELSARIHSLNAQIRPLLSAPADHVPHVDPLDVLDGLQGSLEESCTRRVRFDLKSAVDLPNAAIEPEPLHHVLLTAIYQALEDSEGDVRVAATRASDALQFSIRYDGKPEPQPAAPGPALRGRALATCVAAAILGPRGGTVRSPADGAGVEIEVPAARE